MNYAPRNPKSVMGGWALFMAWVVWLAAFQSECRALPTYDVTINTSAFAGQSGYLAFDLIGGDSLAQNNTVTIGGLATNGSLGDSTNVSLSDTGFFNEELRAILFGSYLNFSLQLTENNAPAGVDEFSFFLLDSSYFPIGATTDPLLTDTLFTVDIDGHTGGNVTVYDSLVSNTSWTVALQPAVGVPDNEVTVALLGMALASLAALRRKFSHG